MDESVYDEYSSLTLAVESLLETHPEFAPEQDPAFSEEEIAVFRAIWTPDWNALACDYRTHLDRVHRKDPAIIGQANQVLHRFADRHGIRDLTGLTM